MPPGHLPLSRYLEWLRTHHAGAIEFVVLFGSRARGDALEDSDYDLLVGLCRADELRLTDRIAVYQDLVTGKVEVLPYPVSELRQMLDDRNGLVLNALADGLTLYDRGPWSDLQAEFRTLLKEGEIRRFPGGWEFVRPE